MKSNEFEAITLKRYSDKKFSRLYYDHSKAGLKDYEALLADKFLKKVKRILIIGSGCGREVVPLAKKGYSITAIDFSKEMIRQSKRLCKESNVKARLLCMDARNLSLRPKFFDAILLFNCLINQIPTHKNRQKVADECHRVLKKNGICIVVSNNALCPGKNLRYWIDHLKSIKEYIKNRKEKEFFDRVYYDNNQKVYIHLPTPAYLKSLFRKKFNIILFTSVKNFLKKGTKMRFKDYFAPNLLLVLIKKGK